MLPGRGLAVGAEDGRPGHGQLLGGPGTLGLSACCHAGRSGCLPACDAVTAWGRRPRAFEVTALRCFCCLGFCLRHWALAGTTSKAARKDEPPLPNRAPVLQSIREACRCRPRMRDAPCPSSRPLCLPWAAVHAASLGD